MHAARLWHQLLPQACTGCWLRAALSIVATAGPSQDPLAVHSTTCTASLLQWQTSRGLFLGAIMALQPVDRIKLGGLYGQLHPAPEPRS